jgi:putative membrane protein
MSDALYAWLKAFHLIAAIAWMAGMLYLPRLFVYHCGAEPGSPQSETFKRMERRLLKAIINPAMIATWVLGLWLVWSGGWLLAGWFHAKLVLVVILSGVHGLFARWLKDFAADRNRHTATFYRLVNEVPTVLMIGIVIFAIVKPF